MTERGHLPAIRAFYVGVGAFAHSAAESTNTSEGAPCGVVRRGTPIDAAAGEMDANVMAARSAAISLLAVGGDAA